MTTRVTLIGDGAVNSDTILNTTIKADDIGDNAVTSDKLQSGANDNVRAVGTNHIKNGSVTSEKLETDSNGKGKRTVSTSAPTASTPGSDGDIWYVV